MWLLLLAVALADEGGEVCLLTLRSGRSQTSDMWTAHKAAMAEWSQRHVAAKQALQDAWLKRQRDENVQPKWLEGSQEVDMDQFIEQSRKSGDVCHAKVLEVKRTLDGLHTKVDMINAEMEGNLQILESQRRIMEDKERDLKEARTANDEAVQICKKEQALNDDDVQEVNGWIAELINYAQPEVRSSIATDIKYHDEATKWAQELAAHKNASVKVTDSEVDAIVKEIQEKAAKEAVDAVTKKGMLLQLAGAANANTSANWTTEQCTKVAAQLQVSRARLQQHVMNATSGVAFRELDCHASREVLQEEYTKAYHELHRLRDAAAKTRDESYAVCIAEAKGVLEEAETRLNAAIQAATRNMERAEDVNMKLLPLLQDSQRALAKVQKHLEELVPTCDVEDSVSTHLQRVRDLILSLQKCPGRNDFKLTLPKEATEA